MKKFFWIILYFFYINDSVAISSLDSLRERLRGPKAGAHQGGLFAYWPNTLENFEYARRMGSDIVEMDLRLSKDGIPVVYHDDKLDLWTECQGRVGSKTLKELQQCRFINSESAYIPSFEEVLVWAQGRVVIDAEFKDSVSIEPAIRLVQKYNSYAWTYFQAQGSREKYYTAHRLDPQIALLYTISDDQEDLKWALAQEDSLMILEIRKVTRKKHVIDAIHKAGKLVTENSWHMGFPFEIFGASCDKLFQLGIDIAISNRPKGCVQQRNRCVSVNKRCDQGI